MMGDARDSEGKRAVSNTVAVVLLMGMIVTTGALVLFVGSSVVTDYQADARVTATVDSFREVDARISQVTFGNDEIQSVEFADREGSSVSIREGSYVNITVDENPNCRVHAEMGSIVRDFDDDGEVAYEGGGVWRETGGTTSMISPPDFQYRNGTIEFPIVNVGDSGAGRIDRLVVDKDVDASREANRNISRMLSEPACRDPENVTVTVASEYYDAWGQFLGETTGSNVTYDDAEGSASLTLREFGSSVTVNDDAISASDFEAEIEVLSTGVSGGSSNIDNAPTTFFINRSGEILTPWTDGDPTDSIDPDQDDLGPPTANLPVATTISDDESTSFAVAAQYWNCHDYDDTGIDRTVDGTTYDEYGCDNAGGLVLEASLNQNRENLIALTDGQVVPGNPAGYEYQASLKDILQGKIDDDGRLQLQPNQVVYVYELTDDPADADCDDDGVPGYDADGDGTIDDPDDGEGSSCSDFNDAVVLVTLEENDGISAGNFAIHVSFNQVVISEE
ncbi:DUF7289 family protein [Halorarum halobium]|uniref:DUF7289 family protein n=1 Tax=Halorarum halobium TaxID=3075121 RepID=UPI0028A5EEA4|nr:hypothetical protein [Halobaculum sp. XH14]